MKNYKMIPKVTLWTLITQNHRFVDGTFKETDIASLHTVEKVRLSYDQS